MYYQERNGKFRFFERYKDPVTGKWCAVSVTKTKNTRAVRKEAEKELEQLVALKSKPKDNRVTLEDVMEAYIDYIPTILRPGTVDTQTSACRSILRIVGSQTTIDDMMDNPLKVRQCFQNDERAAETCNHLISQLKHVIKWACEYRLINDYQWIYAIKPFKSNKERITSTNAENYYLSKSEYSALVSAIPKHSYQLLSDYLYLTGCRIGEALALEPADLDFEHHNITINKSRSQKGVVGEPKTAESNRIIYMQPELEKLLRATLDFRSDRERHFSPPYLFLDEKGEGCKGKTFRNYLKRAAAEAGIEKNVGPHMLRHTHASYLYSFGIDKETIARRLGHGYGQEDSVTLKIYTHMMQTREDRDRDMIGNIQFLPSENTGGK